MSSRAKIRHGLLVGSISLLIALISLSGITNPPEGTDLIDSEGPETLELESSAWWNITNTNIHIKGNWTAANSTYDYINGSGTEAYPFIIENIVLNAHQANSCIVIEDTNEYFTIRNCTLFNSTTSGNTGGIILNNVTNGNITDTDIYSCNYGMFINGTENCTISDVFMYSNTNDSVYLLNTNLTLLTDIDCYNNDGHGVYFDSSDNNTLSHSVIRNNELYGVYLDENSSINWVYENYVGYNLGLLRVEPKFEDTTNEQWVNVCYYIIDQHYQNTNTSQNYIYDNDEVGSCVPSPVYGILPPAAPIDIVTVIIVIVVIAAVIVVAVLLKKQLEKKKTTDGSREKESVSSKIEEPKP